MKTILSICSALLLLQPAFAGEAGATNVAGVISTTITTPRDGITFDLIATVTFTRDLLLLGAQDESGCAIFHLPKNDLAGRSLSPGDRVRIRGTTKLIVYDAQAICSSIEILGHGPAPEPKDVPLAKLYAQHDAPANFDNARVRTHGTISDIFRDEIDSRYTDFILSDGLGSVCIAARKSLLENFQAKELIGRKVSVIGICQKSSPDQLRQVRRILELIDPRDVAFLDPNDSDPFAAEEIPSANAIPAFLAPSALKRYRAKGHVIAVWQGENAMLDVGMHRPVKIRLITPEVPAFGDIIEAVGFPESDLFQITLDKAVWRLISNDSSPNRPPLRIKINDLLSDGKGARQVNAGFNGETVLVSGKVIALPAPRTEGAERFLLGSEEVFIHVDCSSCPSIQDVLSVGSTIEICGVCITETEVGRSTWTIPRARNNILVLRCADDIRILSRPSWWTPARLLTVIVALALLVIGFAVLCALFRRLAERRGRELSEETARRAEADFRTYERTRLAVELHDSLAQNLSGISMELDAVERSANDAPPTMREHLALAVRGLNACRTELKGCLWDLRNNALELDNVDAAIRRTVEPHLGEARLSVRFNVARERISDNTMHAILKIIRELVSNAIRHGKASAIRIAGNIEGDQLLFSVQDNGIGFDPTLAPGIEEGHFGLQGILERIEGLDGEMNIRSKPEKGTKVTLSLTIRKPEQ